MDGWNNLIVDSDNELNGNLEGRNPGREGQLRRRMNRLNLERKGKMWSTMLEIEVKVFSNNSPVTLCCTFYTNYIATAPPKDLPRMKSLS
jgi:hypothetical protein